MTWTSSFSGRGKTGFANSIWFVDLRNLLLERFFTEANELAHLTWIFKKDTYLVSSADLDMQILLPEAKVPILGRQEPLSAVASNGTPIHRPTSHAHCCASTSGDSCSRHAITACIPHENLSLLWWAMHWIGWNRNLENFLPLLSSLLWPVLGAWFSRAVCECVAPFLDTNP